MSAVTFSELWTELKQEAVAAVSAAKADLVSLENLIVPVIEQDIVLALGQLKNIAIQAVIETATLSLTGHEKLSTVVTTVFQHAEANSINVGLSDVQLLAQQAYTAVATSVGQPK